MKKINNNKKACIRATPWCYDTIGPFAFEGRGLVRDQPTTASSSISRWYQSHRWGGNTDSVGREHLQRSEEPSIPPPPHSTEDPWRSMVDLGPGHSPSVWKRRSRSPSVHRCRFYSSIYFFNFYFFNPENLIEIQLVVLIHRRETTSTPRIPGVHQVLVFVDTPTVLRAKC